MTHPGGDSERRLTTEGRELIRSAGQALYRLGMHFDYIVASPFVRAAETAALIAEETQYAGQVLSDKRLIPSSNYEAVADLIHELNGVNSILLVCHQPMISDVISGITSTGHLMLNIPPGSITATEIRSFRPHANGTLEWTMPAEMLRKV